MVTFITILHVFLCILLVAMVLLQHGKGAEIGVVFGGGAGQTVFGSRGAGNFLSKLTTGSAILFMATSMFLSTLTAPSSPTDLLEDQVPAEEPAGLAPPPLAPAGDVPSGFEQIPAPKPAGEAEPTPAEEAPATQ